MSQSRHSLRCSFAVSDAASCRGDSLFISAGHVLALTPIDSATAKYQLADWKFACRLAVLSFLLLGFLSPKLRGTFLDAVRFGARLTLSPLRTKHLPHQTDILQLTMDQRER